jgi:hypothetical protein
MSMSFTRSRALVLVLAALLLSSGAAVVADQQPSTTDAPGWCCFSVR